MKKNIPFILLILGLSGACAITTIPGTQSVLAIIVGASLGVGLGLLIHQLRR